MRVQAAVARTVIAVGIDAGTVAIHGHTHAHHALHPRTLCARALGCVRSSRRLSAFVIGCVRACRAAARGGDDLRVVRRAAAAVRAGHAGFQYYDDGL